MTIQAVKGPAAAQGGIPGRGLPGDEIANRLQAGPRPAHVEGPGDLLVTAGHHRGGQHEGIFQPDAAKIAGQVHGPLLHPLQAGPGRLKRLEYPANLNGPLRAQAGALAGRAAAGAGVLLGKGQRRPRQVVKVQAAHSPGRVYPLRARPGTGRLRAQHTPARLRHRDIGFPKQ